MKTYSATKGRAQRKRLNSLGLATMVFIVGTAGSLAVPITFDLDSIDVDFYVGSALSMRINGQNQATNTANSDIDTLNILLGSDGDFSLNPGDSTDIDLFVFATNERGIGNDDTSPQPIEVHFNFLLPPSLAGSGNTLSGTAQGVMVSGPDYVDLVWSSPITAPFDDGVLQIALNDASVSTKNNNTGNPFPREAQITGTFTFLNSNAAPTPVGGHTAPLLGSSLLAFALMRRRSRRKRS